MWNLTLSMTEGQNLGFSHQELDMRAYLCLCHLLQYVLIIFIFFNWVTSLSAMHQNSNHSVVWCFLVLSILSLLAPISLSTRSVHMQWCMHAQTCMYVCMYVFIYLQTENKWIFWCVFISVASTVSPRYICGLHCTITFSVDIDMKTLACLNIWWTCIKELSILDLVLI